MISDAVQIVNLLSAHLADKLGMEQFLFVRKNGQGAFPDYPFGSYSVLPVASDLQGAFPLREMIADEETDSVQYMLRKTIEATISISIYGGNRITSAGNVVSDPLESSYDIADMALDYFVSDGVEDLRKLGYVIRPTSSIADRTFSLPDFESEYVVGFDVVVKSYKYKTITIDLVDIDSTESDFFENIDIASEVSA